MIIQYSDDLDKQVFAERTAVLRDVGVEMSQTIRSEDYLILGEIDNPVVAFDNALLDRLGNGRLIKGLFGHPQIPTISQYDGTINAWFSNLRGTWPASIDTLVHLRGQRESEALKSAESVLDFACGTGMAGAYARDKNLGEDGIKKIAYLDIQPNAVESAKMSTNLHSPVRFKSRATPIFFVSDGFEVLREGEDKYDIIVASAVPATPIHPGMQRPINPMFEGTELLQKLVIEAPRYLNPGGRLIVSNSSCGSEAFDNAIVRSNATKVKTLYERDNAFRVEFLTDGDGNLDRDWITFLVDNGGLQAREIMGHPYRHTVGVKEISFD